MKKILTLIAVTQLITLVAISQTATPDVKTLFSKMEEKINSIKTLSYESEYINFNSGIDDSLSVSKGKIWLTTVPADTIFKTHFHVAYEGSSGKSDYYYDGRNAIDIWHEHKSKDLEKQITVLEPLLQGNGYNRVQSRMSVLPYFNELTNTTALAKMLQKENILIKEDAEKKHWILEWKEDNIADNFYATKQIYVDKDSYLITHMNRKSIWNGTRMGTDLYIKNIRINQPGDADMVSLKQSYPDYKTKYVSNTTPKQTAVQVSFTGKKAVGFSYPSFTGETITLNPAKGKLILLDFWETWCGYCYLAMPRLKELHKKYNAAGLEIIGIVTENRKGVQQVLDNQNFPYKTMYADTKILEQYKVNGRPAYFLIDDQGQILAHAEGSLDKIEQAINQYFEKK